MARRSGGVVFFSDQSGAAFFDFGDGGFEIVDDIPFRPAFVVAGQAQQIGRMISRDGWDIVPGAEPFARSAVMRDLHGTDISGRRCQEPQ